MENIKDRLVEVFRVKDGLARTKELKLAGITPYYMKKFEKDGLIERVKRGVYRYMGEEIPIVNELIEVAKIVPKGVLCLLSAAAYYQLSTINPWTYHIAIERNQKKPVLPVYPPITIYYYSITSYLEEVNEVEINGGFIKIYSMEKTICDMIRYRSKIGKDIMIECIKNYMDRPERNINKLIHCAEKLKVSKLLKQYIEVLA